MKSAKLCTLGISTYDLNFYIRKTLENNNNTNISYKDKMCIDVCLYVVRYVYVSVEVKEFPLLLHSSLLLLLLLLLLHSSLSPVNCMQYSGIVSYRNAIGSFIFLQVKWDIMLSFFSVVYIPHSYHYEQV